MFSFMNTYNYWELNNEFNSFTAYMRGISHILNGILASFTMRSIHIWSLKFISQILYELSTEQVKKTTTKGNNPKIMKERVIILVALHSSSMDVCQCMKFQADNSNNFWLWHNYALEKNVGQNWNIIIPLGINKINITVCKKCTFFFSDGKENSMYWYVIRIYFKF